MSLPGFAAGTSLNKPVGLNAMRTSRASLGDRSTVELQQIGLKPLASSTSIAASAGSGRCIHIDYVPVCHSLNPNNTPFGRCCDFTHEVRCDGRRVSICTLTDCTKFPDTVSQ